MKYIKCFWSVLVIILITSISTVSQNSLLNNLNSTLEEKGIEFEFQYTGEVFSNVSGGNSRNSAYLDNIDIIFNFDLQKLIGWNGARMITYFLGNYGESPCQYTGALQGISNIAAHSTWKLYEFWIEQNINDDFSILLGLFDLNSEFDNRESSCIFINPSHGIGPEFALTGKNGPSIFPTTSLALRLNYNPLSMVNIRTAIFDGIPGNPENPNGTSIILDENDGILFSSEITYSNNEIEFGKNYFKYSIGGWYYTGEFEKIYTIKNEIGRNFQIGNYGIYASLENQLFSENDYSDQGLCSFIRYGIADKNINPVDYYLGIGAIYKGLIHGRDDDILGIALAASHNSENYKNFMRNEDSGNTIEEFEYIIELTYSLHIFEYLQIQPDLQLVINPSGGTKSNHALALGTRLQLSL